MSLSPAVLFYTASILNGVSAPAHVLVGFQTIYDSIKTIPSGKNSVIGKQCAKTCWDYMAATLATLALLNYQWARTGGPRTAEEKGVAWISVIAGAYAGFGCYEAGNYKPLGCMWVAPACSAIAMLL